MRTFDSASCTASSALKGLLVSLAFAVPALPAMAATVTSSIHYDTLGLDNTSWLAPASVSVSDPVSAIVSMSDLPPIPFYGGYNLYHDTYLGGGALSHVNGTLASSVDMRAGGRLVAQTEWSDSFTNTSGAAQSYAMSFSIGGFNAYLGGWTSNHATRDYRGAYEASILVNDVAVWSSGQVFSLQNSTGSLSKSGVDIGTGTITPAVEESDYWQYQLGGYSGTAALGSFAAGQSFNVKYVLRSIGYWSDPDGCSYECGGVSAGIGDPFTVGGSGVSVAAVPEPETYALMLAGLGLMGGVARRRKAARG